MITMIALIFIVSFLAFSYKKLCDIISDFEDQLYSLRRTTQKIKDIYRSEINDGK